MRGRGMANPSVAGASEASSLHWSPSRPGSALWQPSPQRCAQLSTHAPQVLSRGPAMSLSTKTRVLKKVTWDSNSCTPP